MIICSLFIESILGNVISLLDCIVSIFPIYLSFLSLCIFVCSLLYSRRIFLVFLFFALSVSAIFCSSFLTFLFDKFIQVPACFSAYLLFSLFLVFFYHLSVFGM